VTKNTTPAILNSAHTIQRYNAVWHRGTRTGDSK